jgi:AraC-like DNA-binding protein
MDEMMQHSANGKIISDGLLRILLGTLCRELQKAPFVEAGKPLPLNPGKPQHTITHIERYIHQNLAENLTIETLSRRAAMSRTAFTVQFRARTGKSLVEYLTDLRMEKARELLRNGDLAVRHVASDVGVKQSRLRALFQQRVGVSPWE